MAKRGEVQVKYRGQWETLMPFVGGDPLKAVQEIRSKTGLPTRVVDSEGYRLRAHGEEKI